ncbi:hypothetical protein PFY12_06755 [Chryseobacterium camelliae]|uniref:Uncharacterized protein n=1 Tax=Chryseobacterium camelliae TaxID=1265445 RepID=A0ABY7QQ78_9FLAO|nr:hypothetical protein [Chryseobacterium camelliae]WBV61816.1 hypothetical protein PFY12_06755 [Chryseobacterium camelliae]
MFSIWPLARTLEEYHNESDKSFIVFADYLINAIQFGFVENMECLKIVVNHMNGSQILFLKQFFLSVQMQIFCIDLKPVT